MIRTHTLTVGLAPEHSFKVRAVHLGNGTRAETYDVLPARVFSATSADEACTMAERADAGRIGGIDWYFADPQCDTCGEYPSWDEAIDRGNNEYQCTPCYRAALEHGHAHVDHDPMIPECPACRREAGLETE